MMKSFIEELITSKSCFKEVTCTINTSKNLTLPNYTRNCFVPRNERETSSGIKTSDYSLELDDLNKQLFKIDTIYNQFLIMKT
jgi:hypothetical protein